MVFNALFNAHNNHNHIVTQKSDKNWLYCKKAALKYEIRVPECNEYGAMNDWHHTFWLVKKHFDAAFFIWSMVSYMLCSRGKLKKITNPRISVAWIQKFYAENDFKPSSDEKSNWYSPVKFAHSRAKYARFCKYLQTAHQCKYRSMVINVIIEL